MTEQPAGTAVADDHAPRPSEPPGPDPLCDPDPGVAAAHAHLEALLRCWVREKAIAVPATGELTVPLRRGGLVLRAPVLRRSPTEWHRFGPVRLTGTSGEDAGEADPVVVAALLADEAARGEAGRDPARGGVDPGEVADLVARTADSVIRVRGFIRHHRERPTDERDGFLAAEQSLVLGHLHHPAAKSRDGLAEEEAARYSPELRGSFQLHWFAVDADLVSQDAVTGSPALGGRDTAALLAEISGLDTPPGRVLVPAHPWQAAVAVRRPRLEAMVRAGRLVPLGAAGRPWWPTSSVRTLYQPGSPVMLKLSLGLRLTNSRRESTRTELRRGLEVHRLLDAGHGEATERAHPRFRIIRDPGWLAIDDPGRPGGPEVTGLDVAVRESPEDIAEHRCLAGLVAPRPGCGPSLLGGLLAGRGPAAARRWVVDYTDRVLVPMLHLYAATGIGLEAHQQNTLVRLDGAGDVVGGAFRDNQGYYLAASRLPSVLARTGSEESTLAVVDDRLVDDRLSYYLLRNQALAVVGCLGEEGLLPEETGLVLLADRLRAALPDLAAAGPDGDRLARRWLDTVTLPCKANLLTRLHGIDEVLAPLDAQSVYLPAPNPLTGATP
ncbi:siderophore synthetase [Actinoalloteichus sp. AHMU CJ021]|uniref:IucA/IucC family protein n=1 Tax=Actinoalloteichus TaxID=65496 RepID=UPI0004AA7C84|nr:IucA/IucC family protein [Actinoalloteichus caeruleus]AUS77588.1 siderophore synthetase [Actinoalloteichus sp. AHMU CJ021]